MKKRTVRLLAMLLCVMSFVALLPSAALAANDTDSVKEIAANVVKEIQQAANSSAAAQTSLRRFMPQPPRFRSSAAQRLPWFPCPACSQTKACRHAAQ